MNFGIEDETLEFKNTTGEINEAMQSICAMLNKHGYGTIYFGVLPNGEPKGQMINESTLRDISRKIYKTIVPQIVPTIEKRMVDDKAIIEVSFKGSDRPYSAKGVYYIRIADEDRILEPHELRQLFEYNKQESWDSQLSKYTLDDIDIKSLENFYKKSTACGRIKDDDFEPERLLLKIGLVKNGKLTNAGYYLFSKNEPIVLKMAVFATDEKLTFLDISRKSGNIFDLIDEAYTYVKRNILWKAEIVEIPLKALREIICNSFAHARYNSNTEHEITIHPSMVRIYNPGEFPIGYKPEDFVYENIPSKVRNPLILKTLFLSEDVESYSSGLKRVYSECKKNKVDISYITDRDGFTFIFKRNAVNNVVNNVVNDVVNNITNDNLSVDEEMVINIIKDNPYYTCETISKLINKSPRSVQRTISELKKKGIIERIGGTRGYWKVNK